VLQFFVFGEKLPTDKTHPASLHFFYVVERLKYEADEQDEDNCADAHAEIRDCIEVGGDGVDPGFYVAAGAVVHFVGYFNALYEYCAEDEPEDAVHEGEGNGSFADCVEEEDYGEEDEEYEDDI